MSGTPRRKAGPLGPQVEGYRDWLVKRGYPPTTVRNMLQDVGHVGRWLSAAGLEVQQFDEDSASAFIAFRRVNGPKKKLGPRSMVPLVSYLREVGAVPVARPPLSALGALIGQYRLWLVQERGLAEQTVIRYEKTARRFLQQQAVTGEHFDPMKLTGPDINEFLLRECARVSMGSAKGRVAELRSVLRFLYLQGLTAMPLAAAVPPVGGWRLAALPPPAMSAADVQLLLESCDRSTPVGVRDFAIMMLVARLGLRSIEVARLELRDVRWREGELLVRGKGHRQDRLPLPSEVGEALVAYLSNRDPGGNDRYLFMRCRAPRGPIRADLVGDVVERACKRAGMTKVGPHRLRHALASELLRQGAGLVAISQVLRHQDLATTAVYAKVDLAALRAVAQPWPGASR